MQMNRLRFRFLVRGLSLAWVLLYAALLGGCSPSSEKNRKAPREGAAIETAGHQNEVPAQTYRRARRQRQPLFR